MEKTAMMQLRDKLEAVLKGKFNFTNYDEGYKTALENVIKDIDAQMLAIEKEQYFNAFVAGSERGTGEIPFNCEQYYSQTFGK